MKTNTIPTLLAALALSGASAHADRFAVDFNVVDADGFPAGGSLLQADYEPFDLQHETLDEEFSVERAETFPTPWGDVDFTLSTNKDNEAEDANQVPQAISRGLGSYNGSLPDLAMDWAGIDARRAGVTQFTMTIGGLPAGTYDFLTYHQDTSNQTGQFSVSVDGTVVHEEVDIFDSDSGQNPGPGNPPNFIVTPIESDGSSDIRVDFDLLTPDGPVVQQFFVLNGFILADEGEAVIVNSFAADKTEIFRGESVELTWDVTPGATVDIDPDLGDVTGDTVDGVGSATVQPEDTDDYILTVETENAFEERSITISVLDDIQSFRADPPNVAAGGSTVLSWAINPNATAEIFPEVGNVDDMTDENGFGSVVVSPDDTTEYILEVNYDGLTSDMELEVIVIELGETSTLGDGLVAYWPLDEVKGTRTPDLASGLDMNLSENMDESNVVEGRWGNAFSFDNADQDILTRIHEPGETLPINQNDSFTISMWALIEFEGQSDLRIFSEGSTTDGNPLFNIGTHNAGTDGTVDIFIRNGGAEVNHAHSQADVFDGETWAHVVFVQENKERRLYVNGEEDPVELAPQPEDVSFDLNNTSIGGILRSDTCCLVTGLIDDVAIWDRPLTETEIGELNVNGMGGVFDPLTQGLVAHWPLDEVQGTRTPDVVNGYDMNLSDNMDDSNVIEGRIGNAFAFSNDDQDILSRIHNPGEDLPAQQHESFTVSVWARINYEGQNDLRFFSEGSTTDGNPLFNLGTHNGGTDASVDVFIRNGDTEVGHAHTEALPFDGEDWHHIVFVEELGERTIYVDGVRDSISDSLAARATELFPVNNTSIGGILRSDTCCLVTGDIDEVAIWKRALSEAEVLNLNIQGVPEVRKPTLPLEIREFSADFARVAAGGTATLRWDTNGDATVEISGLGDVTDQSVFGVGSVDVVVNEPTVYVLTVSRGDESVQSQVAIDVIDAEVEPGWAALETFEAYSDGSIDGKGNWINPEGTVTVVDLGANNVLSFEDGNALTALQLKSRAMPVGASNTYFTRFYIDPSDSSSLIDVNFGITERPIRFSGDFNNNVGPFLRLVRPDGGGDIALSARDGVGGALVDSDFEVQPGTIYNVWFDITNEFIEDGDVFSIYIAEEGATERVALFEGFIADRDPTVDPFFGPPGPNLVTAFFSLDPGGQGVESILFDDLFLSIDGFLDTVPVPASNFNFVEPEADPIVLAGAYDENGFTLTWNSEPGDTYSILGSNDVAAGFEELVTGYPEGGATSAFTSWTDPDADSLMKFYQVLFVPPPALFEDDFESGADGWDTVANDGHGGSTSWELGIPSNGPGAAHSPENAFGTNLSGDFEEETDISLITPVIDLTGETEATLSFWHVVDIEEGEDGDLFDFVSVNIHDAEGNLLVEDAWVSGINVSDWTQVQVDLPSEAFAQPIRISFRFFEDGFLLEDSPSQDGWVIDDVRID